MQWTHYPSLHLFASLTLQIFDRVGDVREPEVVKVFVEATVKKFGKLDLLVSRPKPGVVDSVAILKYVRELKLICLMK